MSTTTYTPRLRTKYNDVVRAALKDELESKGLKIGNWRIDERDGEQLQVFFVVAPDGLCYYFHEPVQGA